MTVLLEYSCSSSNWKFVALILCKMKQSFLALYFSEFYHLNHAPQILQNCCCCLQKLFSNIRFTIGYDISKQQEENCKKVRKTQCANL